MRSVNIAELKNRLSAYLQQVRAGEEILIRDRNLPVAKLVPLTPSETSADELELAAAGKLRLPTELLDEEAFWADDNMQMGADETSAVRKSVSDERDERDAGLLGR